MDLFALEQFRVVAECGTMREAAEKLYLSQPTLSYNLKKLEAELGCKLFDRAHNQLRLSPYGEIVLRHSDVLFAGIDSMLEELAECKRLESETLHIGCFSNSVSLLFLPPLAADNPEIMLEVVNDSTQGLVGGLESGKYDLVITSDRNEFKESAFKWRTLYREQACISAPKDTFPAGVCEVTSADLRGLEYTIQAEVSGYSDWYEYILGEANVSRKNIESVQFKDFLRTKDILDRSHLLTTFVSRYIAPSEGRSVIPIAEDFAFRKVGFAYPSDPSPKVLAFVKHVLDNTIHLLSGSAHISYYLFSDDANNLHITSA